MTDKMSKKKEPKKLSPKFTQPIKIKFDEKPAKKQK